MPKDIKDFKVKPANLQDQIIEKLHEYLHLNSEIKDQEEQIKQTTKQKKTLSQPPYSGDIIMEFSNLLTLKSQKENLNAIHSSQLSLVNDIKKFTLTATSEIPTHWIKMNNQWTWRFTNAGTGIEVME